MPLGRAGNRFELIHLGENRLEVRRSSRPSGPESELHKRTPLRVCVLPEDAGAVSILRFNPWVSVGEGTFCVPQEFSNDPQHGDACMAPEVEIRRMSVCVPIVSQI